MLDGRVAWSEAYAVRAGEFIAMDRNLDGMIDVAELQLTTVALDRFDANGDGRLKLSEYIGLHRRSVGMADTDGDGSLSLQEYISAQNPQADRGRIPDALPAVKCSQPTIL